MRHNQQPPPPNEAHLRDQLAAALKDFQEFYAPHDAVRLLGQVHTSSLADPDVKDLQRQERAHFLEKSGTLIALAMAVHGESVL